MFPRLLMTSRVRVLRTISASLSSRASVPGVEYLKLKDGKSLAHEKLESSRRKSRAVIYIYGFLASSQTGNEGSKVSTLRQLCDHNDFTFIR